MKTFVILGMARSATSLLAGALHKAGVHMGDHMMGPGEGNPKGFFEDLDFRALDIAILRAAGGKGQDPGHEPPSEEAILGVRDQFRGRILDLIRARNNAGHELWGWKNPRTALTVRLYHPYLTNPHYITIYRDPQEVGLSLQRMLGWPVKKGIALCRTYDDRISRFVEEFIK